jgi:hypothetical protein
MSAGIQIVRVNFFVRYPRVILFSCSQHEIRIFKCPLGSVLMALERSEPVPIKLFIYQSTVWDHCPTVDNEL